MVIGKELVTTTEQIAQEVDKFIPKTTLTAAKEMFWENIENPKAAIANIAHAILPSNPYIAAAEIVLVASATEYLLHKEAWDDYISEQFSNAQDYLADWIA